ncbi:MAG: hypothetical protein K1X88_07520 [Nannocystaceae bacterium]|nr:hypothetical protein [Nannocystaceae bacterium]
MLALLVASGCVFPNENPTGIEFSWLFREAEGSDGDEGRRVLTCTGVGIETLAATVVDQGDETRHGVFRFGCSEGFQTDDDLARTASEAFLELHPRAYDVTLWAGDENDHEVLSRRAVDVLSRSVTLELWELTRAPIDWSLQVVHPEACAALTLSLEYADPAEALAEPELDDEGDAVPTLYRSALSSDRGLSVSGAQGSCAAAEGMHRFAGVDRGHYRLVVAADEAQCAFEVELGAGVTTTLDLAALPCG